MLEYPDWTPLKSQTDHPKISKCEPSFFVNSWHNFYVRKGGGGGGQSRYSNFLGFNHFKGGGGAVKTQTLYKHRLNYMLGYEMEILIWWDWNLRFV